MPFCQGTKPNSWLFPSFYGNISMSVSHVKSMGSWYTVYVMFLSNNSALLPEIHTVQKCDFLKYILHSQKNEFSVLFGSENEKESLSKLNVK